MPMLPRLTMYLLLAVPFSGQEYRTSDGRYSCNIRTCKDHGRNELICKQNAEPHDELVDFENDGWLDAFTLKNKGLPHHLNIDYNLQGDKIRYLFIQTDKDTFVRVYIGPESSLTSVKQKEYDGIRRNAGLPEKKLPENRKDNGKKLNAAD